MKAKVTPDGRFIQIVDGTDLELDQVRHSFKKRISNWRFHPLVKKKIWDGNFCFIEKKGSFWRVPIGLWREVFEIGKEW